MVTHINGVLPSWEDDLDEVFPPSVFDVRDGDKRREWYVIPGTKFLLRVHTQPMIIRVFEETQAGQFEENEAITESIRQRFSGDACTAESFRKIGRFVLEQK